MKKLLLATLLLLSGAIYAQNVGIGTKQPHESAILDLRSSSKGFLLPRLTEKQRNAIPAPAEGLMIYQTGANQGIYIYQAGKWNNLNSATSASTRFQNATIGTLTPDYLLVGDASGNVVSSNLYYNNGRLGLGSIDTSIALNAYLPKSTTSTVAKFGTLNNSIALNVNSDGSTEIVNVNNGIGKMYLKNGNNRVMTITDDGKIGIGTNSPYTQFAIADTGRTFEFGYSQRLGGMTIETINRNSQTGMDFIHYVESLASHRFYTQGTEKVRLNHLGNLGIGNTNPVFSLDVLSTHGSAIMAKSTDTSGYTKVRVQNNQNSTLEINAYGSAYRQGSVFLVGAGGIGLTTANGNFGLGTYSLHPLILGTNNQEVARITPNGSFGIGTTNPRSKLEVNGVISTQSGAFEGGGYKLHLASHHTGSRTWSILNDYYNYGDFAILQSKTQTSSAKDSSIARFYINQFGNVGIGTTSPTATLDVRGTLKATKINGLAIGIAGLSIDSISNTRVGNNALISLGLDAYDNTAVGYKAMESTGFSNGNIAVGSYTLFRNTSGSDNTAIGYGSLYNSNGNYNIGLGALAGNNLTTGGSNIAIGKNNNFPNPTASNQLVIAASLYGTSIYSDTAKYGINTSSPTATLDVNGTLRVRGGSPGAGKVLTSDANGNASWNTLSTGNQVNIMKYVLPSNHVGRGIVNWGSTPSQTIGTAFGYMDAAGVFNVNVAGEYRVTVSYSLSGDPDAFLIGPGNVRFLQFSGTQATGLPINGSVTDYLSLNAGGQIYWRFNNNVTLNAGGYNSKIIIEKIN